MAVFQNKDLYPTPNSVLDLMDINCQDKVCLEPQAGFGNIITYLKLKGAKEVMSCEIENDLIPKVSQISNFIRPDFLNVTKEQISNVQLIVMNPPFSNGYKHILHAWEIAPDGCEIITLCNYETIAKENRYAELASLIKNYGSSESLGNCFSNSERKTDVVVGLIKLKKPAREGFDFNGFYMDEDDEPQGDGIMSYNAVRDVVNRYVRSVKIFEEMDEKLAELNTITKPIGGGNLSFSISSKEVYGYKKTNVEVYARDLQKKAWKKIFNDLDVRRFVTSGVMNDVNKFVDEQSEIPFTMKNIYHMIDIIFQTREQAFNRSIEEAVDRFTRHHHENRYNVEGWKTNSGYMINRKFIVGYIVDQSYSRDCLQPRIGNRNTQYLNDLYKVLCHIMGDKYERQGELSHSNQFERGVWTDWTYFEVKCFNKGSMHLKFKDEKVWYKLNQAYGKLKGFTLYEK